MYYFNGPNFCTLEKIQEGDEGLYLVAKFTCIITLLSLKCYNSTVGRGGGTMYIQLYVYCDALSLYTYMYVFYCPMACCMIHRYRKERKMFESYQQQARTARDKKDKEDILILRSEVCTMYMYFFKHPSLYHHLYLFAFWPQMLHCKYPVSHPMD